MTPPFGGHCLCHAITYVCNAAPLWQAHCHCESCRRAVSSGFTSFFGIADGHWRWTGAAPTIFPSSSKAQRFFCPICGSQMAYRSVEFPSEMHFHAASLDDPLIYAPTGHVHGDERLPWVHLADGLPQT